MAELVECDMCKRVWVVPPMKNTWGLGIQQGLDYQLCADCRAKVEGFIVANMVKPGEAPDADASRADR